jgi:hypothetical protein
MVNVFVIFVSFLFWKLHISWIVLLTVHPPTSLPKFGISEWLAAFSFVISFYFLLSLGHGSRNRNTEEVQIAWTLNSMLVKNKVLSAWSIHYVFLLLFFPLVSKHNVVWVRITCDMGSSISEEFTVWIVKRCSENGGSRFLHKIIHSRLFCDRVEGNIFIAFWFEMRSWNGWGPGCSVK